MNPTTLFSLGLPALVAWSLLDDFEKARIKRGLCPEIDPIVDPIPLERVIESPAAVEPSTPKTFEERKIRLIEVLEEHRLTPVWELRNATPIRFTGWQRSGKSTKAQTLALLRQIDDLSHPVTVCTPHRLTPGDRPWSSSFSVSGMGNAWAEIQTTIDRLMQRLDAGNTAPHTTILDEFSGYAGKVGGDGYLQELMLSAVREMAKHNEFLILIAHGDTAAMNGGIKGLSAAMWGNFVTVQCNRRLQDGKPMPSPQTTIHGGGFPEVSLNWPEWFCPEWLLENFPELGAIVPTLPDRIPLISEPFRGSLEPESNEPESNSLEPHLKAIVDYITRKGQVTPRQVQTAKLKALVDCNINKIEPIQLCLDTLVYEGVLQACGIDTYSVVDCGSNPKQRVDNPHSLPQHIHNIHIHNPHPENY